MLVGESPPSYDVGESPPYDVTAAYHHAYDDDVTADYGISDYYVDFADYAADPRVFPNGTSGGCFPDDVTPGGMVTCNVTWGDAVTSSGAAGSNWWALMLIVFPVLTVFGNVLVVMSVYREKTLQSVTNYFIVSLAVADIMVAVLVMPLAVYVEVRDRPISYFVCKTIDIYIHKKSIRKFSVYVGIKCSRGGFIPVLR